MSERFNSRAQAYELRCPTAYRLYPYRHDAGPAGGCGVYNANRQSPERWFSMPIYSTPEACNCATAHCRQWLQAGSRALRADAAELLRPRIELLPAQGHRLDANR
jgi:hypothetical protein